MDLSTPNIREKYLLKTKRLHFFSLQATAVDRCEKHGQGPHCIKMGADSLAKNTPKCSRIYLPKPKSSRFQWKNASLGVRTPWSSATKKESSVTLHHRVRRSSSKGIHVLYLCIFLNESWWNEFLIYINISADLLNKEKNSSDLVST